MPHDGAASLELTDTSERAEARYWERVRATPPAERLHRALRLSERVRAATWADVQRQHPGASRRDLAVAFLRRVYGDAIADGYAARHPVP
jgi:hypothetical protein